MIAENTSVIKDQPTVFIYIKPSECQVDKSQPAKVFIKWLPSENTESIPKCLRDKAQMDDLMREVKEQVNSIRNLRYLESMNFIARKLRSAYMSCQTNIPLFSTEDTGEQLANNDDIPIIKKITWKKLEKIITEGAGDNDPTNDVYEYLETEVQEIKAGDPVRLCIDVENPNPSLPIQALVQKRDKTPFRDGNQQLVFTETTDKNIVKFYWNTNIDWFGDEFLEDKAEEIIANVQYGDNQKDSPPLLIKSIGKLSYKALYDHQTRTIVLIRPTQEELEVLEKIDPLILYYAGHGDALELHRLNLQHYKMSPKHIILSACLSGREPNWSYFTSTDRLLNFLIISTAEEAYEYIKTHKASYSWELLPDATEEAEWVHYLMNYTLGTIITETIEIDKSKIKNQLHHHLSKIFKKEYTTTIGKKGQALVYLPVDYVTNINIVDITRQKILENQYYAFRSLPTPPEPKETLRELQEEERALKSLQNSLVKFIRDNKSQEDIDNLKEDIKKKKETIKALEYILKTYNDILVDALRRWENEFQLKEKTKDGKMCIIHYEVKKEDGKGYEDPAYIITNINQGRQITIDGNPNKGVLLW